MPSATLSASSTPLPEALSGPLQRHLHTARELWRRSSETAPPEPFATSVAPLDALLSGGLPRGQLVELVGRRTCGRYSIVLATLAAATAAAEATALIDLGSGFDPQTATAAGAHLERLLWVRPQRLKEAMISAETLLNTGFPLVVLDLGQPPVPGGRGAEAFWLRLARAAEARDSALLVSSPYRMSGTAAAAVLEAAPARPIWNGREVRHGYSTRLLAGLRSELALEKFNGQASRAGRSGVSFARHA